MVEWGALDKLFDSDYSLFVWRPESDSSIPDRLGGSLLPDLQAWEEWILPEDRTRRKAALTKHLNSRTRRFKLEPYRIRLPDSEQTLTVGEICYVLAGSPEGQVLSLLSHVTLHSGENGSEDNSRERLELAARATGDGFWDWNLRTGEVFFSRQWKEMLGYSDEEIGNTLEEWRSRVHPDDLPGTMASLQNHIKGNTDYYVNEHRLRNKAGGYLWVLDRGRASRDEKGKPYRMVGFHTDITSHRELEEGLRAFSQMLEERVTERTLELRRQLSKFQLLFNGSKDGFFIHYLKGEGREDTLIEVNDAACQMLGQSREELADRSFSQLFQEEDREDLQAFLEQIKTQGSGIYRGRMKSTEGHAIHIELNAQMFQLANGEACFSSARDITDRLSLEEKNQANEQMLIQQSRMAAMGEMIGAIAHQWKQPLNAISLAAGMIPDACDAEELKETEDIILNQVDFLSRTISEFRDFFRPNREKQVFLACESAAGLMKILGPVLQREGIEVRIHPHEHFSVFGRPNELQQVLLNIVVNARDAFVERGISGRQVQVYHENDSRTGTIRILDNAGGIQEDLLPDRLFQANVSTKGEKGTGIGLSLARTIIEDRMGGTIRVRNADAGAEFTISLPLVESETEAKGKPMNKDQRNPL